MIKMARRDDNVDICTNAAIVPGILNAETDLIENADYVSAKTILAEAQPQLT